MDVIFSGMQVYCARKNEVSSSQRKNVDSGWGSRAIKVFFSLLVLLHYMMNTGFHCCAGW